MNKRVLLIFYASI